MEDIKDVPAEVPQTVDATKLEVKVVPTDHRYIKWYNVGKRSKKFGWERLSPFAGKESATKEFFFLCGYDGISFENAQTLLKDKVQETLASSPEIATAINELASSIEATV